MKIPGTSTFWTPGYAWKTCTFGDDSADTLEGPEELKIKCPFDCHQYEQAGKNHFENPAPRFAGRLRKTMKKWKSGD